MSICLYLAVTKAILGLVAVTLEEILNPFDFGPIVTSNLYIIIGVSGIFGLIVMNFV